MAQRWRNAGPRPRATGPRVCLPHLLTPTLPPLPTKTFFYFVLSCGFQKEMMSQSRAAEEEKKRALQKTVDRLSAQHRAELAIAAKMGQRVSPSKVASGTKESSSQRNRAAGGSDSSSDSGPESDDEEKLQFQRQQEKLKKMRKGSRRTRPIVRGQQG